MSRHDWRASAARMRETLAGEIPDRVPFAFDLQEDIVCRVVGANVRELMGDAERLAEAAVQTAEFVGQDDVDVMGAYAGPYEGLAFAAVNDAADLFHWRDHATPGLDGGKLCATADDVRRLRIPDHREVEPWPTVFHAIKLVAEETGVWRESFGAGMTWAVVQMLRGARAYTDVRRDPGLLLELCEKIYASQMDLFRTQCELTGRRPASIFGALLAFDRSMLSFDDAWQFEGQFMVRFCKETGLPLMIHDCGSEPYWHELLDRLIGQGVTVLAVNGSHPVDLEQWLRFRQAYPEVAILGATISVNAELEHGSPRDVEEIVRRNIQALAPTRRYVVMPTCCPHWRIPLRNLLAVRAAVEKYGACPPRTANDAVS